ncbi:lytic murein transglycosylase B [Massilia sp. S19_KUP03_FR1]|uniref:lytic murein transglycosylase B n=1 Tax=Massilia sp. S19_KUP03_FR1 TaxID=3025503 RepID=UPI002FCCE7A6
MPLIRSRSLLAALALLAAALAAPAGAAPEKHPKATKVLAKAKAKASAKKTAKAKPAAALAPDAEAVNFSAWSAVQQFEEEMVAKHGFNRAELDTLFGQARLLETAVQLVKPAPPGKPKNWQLYSSRFIEPIRINAGVRFWNENAGLLARAEQIYGVPAEILVGIIGVETVFGRDTGKFRVIDTLTTLAFAYPEAPNRVARMAFFRGELENTLLLAQHAGIDPFSLLGSFAGAVGLPQFMPGSILKWGVDFDNDGRVDLRGSVADAIGSVANFLVVHGWKREDTGPAVFAAQVAPSRDWESLLGKGLTPHYRPDELSAAGVNTAVTLPPGRLYGLVDLQNGADATEYWVASDNFYAITNYNRSYFYAMSVIDLGRAVRLTRGN